MCGTLFVKSSVREELRHVAVVGRPHVGEQEGLLPARPEHRHLALNAVRLSLGALAAPELVELGDVRRVHEQIEIRVRPDLDAVRELLPVAQDDVEDVVLVQQLEELADRLEHHRPKTRAGVRHRLREAEEVRDRHLEAHVAVVEVDERVLLPELGVLAVGLAQLLVEVRAELDADGRRVDDLVEIHQVLGQLEMEVLARRAVARATTAIASSKVRTNSIQLSAVSSRRRLRQ